MTDHEAQRDETFASARMTSAAIEAEIAAYESEHGFDSDQLRQMQADGTLPDTYAIQDWLSLLALRQQR